MFTQKERWYPPLPHDTHPDVVTAFREVYNHVYTLRDEIQKMRAEKPSEPARPKFNDNILGIKVKAVTDPSSLQNGFTLRYNSATGQLEWGV